MDLTALILDIAKQGPLVGILLYQLIRNQRLIDERDAAISALHKEMREIQDKSFERLAAIKRDGDAVLSALKDAFKG